ncbi:FMN reductase [Nocardiopsis terrae]|uniref:Multimeric flavodoxin WrbA n=1 Tax=Nocardiopsis terrae TaxID=372655 RepID=A0ABR9HC06_9ACTN|nr:flavodoxin family protein [Nocardiopsis terrae]MBE1456562.1 multimeric flavodoxin WrbA [Nocardiopsis terrae]GHC76193.1 FMN reductase [Nocardiopsis terrae]
MHDVRVAVAFHSGYGHTARQAEAVARGAASTSGARSSLHDVTTPDGALWAALDSADAIVFGTPTYMGGGSAVFQGFAEATAPVWQERRWQGKLAAGFTNSAGTNGNKDTALSALAVFAAQHGMIWVPLGLAPGGEYSSRGSRADLNRLAGFTGAMAQSPSDLGPDQAPDGSDLRTAEHLGAQVAQAAVRFEHGRRAVAA